MVLTVRSDAIALVRRYVIRTQRNVYVNLEVKEQHAESVRILRNVTWIRGLTGRIFKSWRDRGGIFTRSQQDLGGIAVGS